MIIITYKIYNLEMACQILTQSMFSVANNRGKEIGQNGWVEIEN